MLIQFGQWLDPALTISGEKKKKKIIDAIQILYTETSATVHSTDGETSPFDICARILHGDTIAPFLFYNCHRLCTKNVS